MRKTSREMLDSRDFRRLVARRWLLSTALTAVLFLVYYGYILLIAINKPLMARRLGEGPTTLGIPLGIGVILISWILTAVYVAWANRTYDTEAHRLRDQLH